MKQIWFFHGGDSFLSHEAYLQNLRAKTIDYERLKPQRKWREWIASNMSEADCLLPTMPNSSNAVYSEWEITFEKFIPLFSDDVQLVGHSLGAMFLAKYLHLHRLDSKVAKIILIGSGYNNLHEDYGSFKVESALGIEKSADEIHLIHSKDDPIVPFSELAKFQNDLPNAISHIFEGRGHFIDETFPELLEILKK